MTSVRLRAARGTIVPTLWIVASPHTPAEIVDGQGTVDQVGPVAVGTPLLPVLLPIEVADRVEHVNQQTTSYLIVPSVFAKPVESVATTSHLISVQTGKHD